MDEERVEGMVKEGGDDAENVNYRAPPEKSITEILEADKDDESLTRYKVTLLGSAASEAPIVDPNNPNKVIVKGLALITQGRPDLYLDLTGLCFQLTFPTKLSLCSILITQLIYFHRFLLIISFARFITHNA